MASPKRLCCWAGAMILGLAGVALWVDCEPGSDADPTSTRPSGDTSGDRNDLGAMDTARVVVKGQSFEVWIADTPETRQLGLMQVTPEELAPLPDGTPRGMLFVFPSEQPLAFWMHNTITPLDIAYIRDDGQIVTTHTMAPLETVLYPSVEPARYALEVPAGLFARLGIGRGDRVEIPDSVLKGAS